MAWLASRNIVLLLGSQLLASIPVGYLLVVLPLYLNRAGLEPGLIGLLYSLSGLVTAFLVAFSGVLADRFGRQRFLIVGTALPMLSYAIFALTTQTGWLILASIIGGVGLANGAAGALTAASFDAILAEHTPARQRTSVFAWAQALWSLALALGSLAAALPDLLRRTWPGLGDLDAYRPPFLVIIAISVLATAMLLPMRAAFGAGSESDAGTARRGWLPRRSLGVIARYSLALGMFGLGLGIAVQLLPLWFKLRFGVDEAALGPWYAAAQAFSLGSVVVSPWLDRRLGSAGGVVLVQVLGSLCLVWIALIAPTFELAILAFLARNVLANLAWPLQQALLMARAAPEERASAAGVGFSIWGLTNALGPAIGGALMQSGSLVLPVMLGAVAYGLGGLAFGIGFRRPAESPLRLGGHGPGVDGQDGDRDGREPRDRQGDRSRAGG
ncbi:MAG TPA: MFS transporter [Chloroflexota bacterium]